MRIQMTATGTPAPPGDPASGPVSIVIPAYGAAQALGRCLDSVLAHTDLGRHRLLVVADGPQPEAVESQLTALVGQPNTVVLCQLERRGFVAAANRGMAATARDVILLNSDTRVTAGWVEKLAAAAHSAPRIASATPWTNSGTICSLPRWLEHNALPADWGETRFNRLVEDVSLRAYPALPTGVGFCLYLKRQALDSVGGFAELAFGLGYGEENDWCARASKAGWTHVLDDATFIFHEGQASFGASTESRVRQAHRAIRRRHPEFLPAVSRFLTSDPLRPLRERVLAALRPARSAPHGGVSRWPQRVLHVVHGWPPWNHAGTELYAAWLARWQTAHRNVSVYARIADASRRDGQAIELEDHGVRVRLLVNNFRQRNPLSRNALSNRGLERDFAALLDEERPELLHVHHLAGHCATLPAIARRRGIRVLFQLQDWWAACARANLLDHQRRLCSGPGLGKCSRCLPLTRRPGAALWNRLLYAYRGRVLRQSLRAADALVTSSEFLAASYRRLGVIPLEAGILVRPYGTPTLDPSPGGRGEQAGGDGLVRARAPAALPIRCGFVGSLLPHKGVHVALTALQGLAPVRVTLELWGDARADPAYTAELHRLAGPGITFHPPFAEADKENVLRGLDVLLVPSLGLESFGLVAYEAMAQGTPVIASQRGALPDLFASTTQAYGATFDPDRPQELGELLGRIAADPGLLDRWRAALPAVKTFASHAREIEEIYERLRGPTAG
jgi:GT2 family glycosyltransferase